MKITAKQVIDRLYQEGYQETHVRGDHHRFTDKYGHKVSVPYTHLKDVIFPTTYRYSKQQADWH